MQEVSDISVRTRNFTLKFLNSIKFSLKQFQSIFIKANAGKSKTLHKKISLSLPSTKFHFHSRFNFFYFFVLSSFAHSVAFQPSSCPLAQNSFVRFLVTWDPSIIFPHLVVMRSSAEKYNELISRVASAYILCRTCLMN